MEHQKNLIVLLVGCGILAGGFYWFELRPTSIRKNCYDYAYPTKNLLLKDQQDATEAYYLKCLRENGLKDGG